MHYHPGNPIEWDFPLTDLQSRLSDKDGLVWVSLEVSSLEESNSILKDTFKFHPLTIEDAQSEGYQTPKIDEFENYVFIVMMAPLPDDGSMDFGFEEYNLFLGENYIVTNSKNPKINISEKVRNRLKRDERVYQHGSDFLAHALIDQLVDDIRPAMEILEQDIEEIEDTLILSTNTEILQRVLKHKHTILQIRRAIAPMREVVNRLARGDVNFVDKQAEIYFRDVYDHLVRIYDWAEMLRDAASSALDVYLNATSLQLNKIMKALAIVSTIFLPLSFLAGVWGMNFKYMPELNWKLGYPMAWTIFIAVVLTMIYVFKRQKWF